MPLCGHPTIKTTVFEAVELVDLQHIVNRQRMKYALYHHREDIVDEELIYTTLEKLHR